MGSQFIDIYVADPAEAHAAVRGDRPELFAAMFAGDEPPPEELRPAFAVMEAGTFCFLAKGRSRPDGLLYCRAFEHILRAIGGRRWGIECYVGDSAYFLSDLAFGRCEADWLTLPRSGTGVADSSWRAPRTSFSMANQAARLLASGDYERRFVSPETLREIQAACAEGYRNEFGVFTIYQA